MDVGRVSRVGRGSRSLPTTGVTVTTSRERVVLPPGESRAVSITVEAAVRPAAPGALTGAVRASVQRGPRLRIPWSVAVPVTRLPVVSRVRLSAASFRASDTRPAQSTRDRRSRQRASVPIGWARPGAVSVAPAAKSCGS